jgi:putative hydrolase of the HAD superfamily
VDLSLTDADADRHFSRYLESYEQAWALFPDVVPCLDGLVRHRLGVITNGQREQQFQKLVRTGILHRFECIVVPADCAQSKPHADIFHHACVVAGERPEQSVYVGDAYDLDAVGARNAGLAGVWLDRTGEATPHHIPPFIRTLAELPAVITALDAGQQTIVG